MATKPPSIPISQPDFLIAQLEWVVQINNTRVVIRECNRCFALYYVKNTRHNCPCFSCVVCFLVFPLGWVLHCHCTITRETLTSIIRALVVSVPCLAVLFQRPYYTVLYTITLTIVSSIFLRTYFQNYPRQKQKNKTQYFYNIYNFLSFFASKLMSVSS